MNPRNLKDGEIKCMTCGEYFRNDDAFDVHTHYPAEGCIGLEGLKVHARLCRNKRMVWCIPLPSHFKGKKR